MKSILKVGLFGGLLLGLGYLFISPDTVFALHLVVIPGAVMFAINGFLWDKENQKKYTYYLGVAIGLLVGVLCALVGFLMLKLFNQNSSSGNIIEATVLAVQASLPLIAIASILVPVLYLKKSTKDDKHSDILDESL